MMWDNGWGKGGWFGGAFMLLLMVLFLAAVVVAIIFVVRALSSHAAPPTPTERTPRSDERFESAQDILKRRYAAGEIDREEYLQKRDEL
jgi:putative membrane protein